ncbi:MULTISPECIES: hypothetical protein [unclassified Streptomyces]|uniref:hypothetical protein n=1 Tax=unclassified Streptomyces TaxID=2593676 RepID=UPI0037F2B5A4
MWNVAKGRTPSHRIRDYDVNLVVRPNPVLAPWEAYEAKSARWRQVWPEPTVLDWPTT